MTSWPFTSARDYPGIMTAIDFEKAFDSLNWNFVSRSLESFGFGTSFLAWIRTFYKNITSCVANNGFFTPSFKLKPGVRQGDPLSRRVAWSFFQVRTSTYDLEKY